MKGHTENIRIVRRLAALRAAILAIPLQASAQPQTQVVLDLIWEFDDRIKWQSRLENEPFRLRVVDFQQEFEFIAKIEQLNQPEIARNRAA